MGMGMEMPGIELNLDFPELNDGFMFIPRRKRSPSSENKPPPMSMSDLEAATVLIAMAYSVTTDVEAFCNRELEKLNHNCRPHRKRKPPMTSEKFESSTKKARKKKKKSPKQKEFPSIPEMPAAMRERIADMGGYEIQLVIQKQLQDTDLNKNHGRLSLPAKKLLVDFATQEERNLLSQQESNKKKVGMNVLIVDHFLRETTICLKKWKIGSGDVYCLMTHWNSFVQQNELKSGEYIQLWCFRRDEITNASPCLCFAMVKLQNNTV